MSRSNKVMRLGLVMTAGFALLGAGEPTIDAAKSTLIITFKQENVPVDASFKSFSGHIQYDPAQPSSARAGIQVRTDSFDLGSADYNAEVRKKSWFDSATYPTASFVSSAAKPTGSGQFTVTGTFTLKGKTQTLNVPVIVSKAGNAMAFDGALEISRKAFGIGDPEWNDVVDDKVRIRFHLLE